MFGPHLIIDGTQCNTAKLADRLLVERILSDYPRAIGMTRIGGPYMFEYQAPDPAYSGVSGLVVIAESHIAIHTFPELDFFTMDIFSCKNFDHEVAIQYIKDAFDVGHMDRMLVQRGLSFRGPHHGPLGATDELIAAAAERHAGIEGITIGSIPTDDPLYPRQQQEGAMIWPSYGLVPDYGSLRGQVFGGVRSGAIVKAVNAEAIGDDTSNPGLSPIQPLQLNHTASTSGVLDRMLGLGGQGRKLGKILAQWEAVSRTNAPVILALGPHILADGAREVVADLIHRGHIDAIIAEGDTVLADAFESLGYRHYVDVESDGEIPVRTEEDWKAAQTALTALMSDLQETVTGCGATAHLGEELARQAPRPGMLTVAAQKQVPVFITGAADLASIGMADIADSADTVALAQLLQHTGASVVAFGTSTATADLIAATAAAPNIIAVDADPISGPCISANIDATAALPLLATGLVQRLPQRSAHSQSIKGEEAARSTR